MPIDFFVTSKDTGANYTEAIQPVKNGEDASQAIFERPSENLRTRTEDIRKQFDLIEAVAASDRGLTVMAATNAYVAWNSTTGVFTVNDNAAIPAALDLYIVPLLSTTESIGGGAPGVAIPSKYVYYDVGNGSKFSIECAADLRDHGAVSDGRRSGANNLFFELKTDAGTPVLNPTVAITGDEGSGTYPADGPITITVTVNTLGADTADILAALAAADPTDEYINTSALVELVAGTCVETRARTRFYDGATGDFDLGMQSMGAIDPEGILIDSVTLASFFAVAGDVNKLMTDGDVLVINFTGADDRLNNQTNTSMSNMLQKLSRNTVAAAKRHVIPICKRYDGVLYFLNGTMFQNGKPGRLIPDPGDVVELTATYDAHVAGTADKHADEDVTANAQTAAAASGQTLPIALPNTSDVRAHIGDLLTYLDNHMDGSEAGFKHPEGDITAATQAAGTPTDQTVPISLPDTTTVRAQLGELLSYLNTHFDGSIAAFKHPEGDVTAASQAAGTPTDQTVPITLPNATDVRAQLGELLSYLNTHFDGSIAAFKHPEGDITAATQAAGTPTDQTVPISLPGTTDVRGQLGELLSYTNTHFDGSIAAFKHPITDTTGRPFAVINSTGTGDYATIQLAIDALYNVGGTIYLRNGTYTGTALDFDAVIKSLTIVGESREGTVLNNTTGPVVTNTTTNLAQVTFTNLTMGVSGGYSVVSLDAGGEASFINVKFIAGNAGAPVFRMVTGSVDLGAEHQIVFDNCYFYCATATLNNEAIDYTNHGCLRVTNCQFYRFRRVLDFKGDDTLWFQNNRMVACGYSPTKDDVGILLHVATTSNYFYIQNNILEGSGGATNTGMWAYLRSPGILSNNHFGYGIGVEPDITDHEPHLKISGDNIQILNNTFMFGLGYGLSLIGDDCLIQGNLFADWGTGTFASCSALISDIGDGIVRARVIGNTFTHGAKGPTGALAVILQGASGAPDSQLIISNNVFSGLLSDNGGITIGGFGNSLCANNTLSGTDADVSTGANNVGIDIGSALNALVTGNTVRHFKVGVDALGSSQCTISGNNVVMNNYNNAAAKGIRTGEDCIVSGNHISGRGNAANYCIDCNGQDDICLMGNMIWDGGGANLIVNPGAKVGTYWPATYDATLQNIYNANVLNWLSIVPT